MLHEPAIETNAGEEQDGPVRSFSLDGSLLEVKIA
jgi:hypothetical protein